MKRLLVISYGFPPSSRVGVFHITRTIQVLEQMGWDITVLTVDMHCTPGPYDERLLDDVPASVTVVRTPSPDKFVAANPYIDGAFHYLGKTDQAFFWYPFAVYAGRQLLNKHHYDVIYSRGAPFTNNIIGLTLQRSSNLPHFAHFSDPWVVHPYLQTASVFYRTINRRLEAMIMRAADKINFTTTQTAAYVMNQYPAEWWQKVCIIPNGYNSNLLDAIDRPPRTHSRLRLVYTGSLSMQRSPETFLRALQHLNQSIPLANQLEVLFVGRGAKSFHRIVEELQLTSIVSLHDPLPIRESLQLAASADVFLVLETLTGNDSIMLHAKIVDYLMLHKPILGVVSPVGAMAELLQRLHYPVVMPNDMTMIATAISRLLESWKAGTLKPAPTHEQVAREYDIRHTTARLDAELRSIL